MNKIIGFIGGGNMASAIIGGILQSGLAEKDQIIASDKLERARSLLKERFGIRATENNRGFQWLKWTGLQQWTPEGYRCGHCL